MSEAKSAVGAESKSKEITFDILETKWKGWPSLSGVDLNADVQEYVQTLKMASGVVNMLVIIVAAAEGIVAARGKNLCLMKAILRLPKPGLDHC